MNYKTLNEDEQYRRIAAAFAHWGIGACEQDLKAMLLKSKQDKSYDLAHEYYKLLNKCRQFDVPFHVIYSLEKAAKKILPASVFKPAENPVRDYFFTRLIGAQKKLITLMNRNALTLKTFIETLEKINHDDGKVMVEWFLTLLFKQKVMQSVAQDLGLSSIGRVCYYLSQDRPAGTYRLRVLIKDLHLDPEEDDAKKDRAILDAMGFADFDFSSREAANSDFFKISEDTFGKEFKQIENLSADELNQVLVEAQSETALEMKSEEVPLDEIEIEHIDPDVSLEEQYARALLQRIRETNYEKMPQQFQKVRDKFGKTKEEKVFAPLTLGADESSGEQDRIGDAILHFLNPAIAEAEPLSTNDSSFNYNQQGSGVGFYSGNYDAQSTPVSSEQLDAEPDSYRKLLEDYQKYFQKMELEIQKKLKIDEAVSQARSGSNEDEVVKLLAQIYPQAFANQRELLLRDLGEIESPLGKIMRDLSEKYRQLVIPPDMRVDTMRIYVSNYIERLESEKLFEDYPNVRDRMVNYLNSLIDPDPKLLPRIHIGLQEIKDQYPKPQVCIAKQLEFLKERLEDEEFKKIWPTILIIAQNLVAEQLRELGYADLQELLASHNGKTPAENVSEIEKKLTHLFQENPLRGLHLSHGILNSVESAEVEKHAAFKVLGEQTDDEAQVAYHFHRTVDQAGRESMERQIELARAFTGTVPQEWITDKVNAIQKNRSMQQSRSRVEKFFAGKDRQGKIDALKAIAKDKNVPEALKKTYIKNADNRLFEEAMQAITVSNNANVVKARLLQMLKQNAQERNWLNESRTQKIDSRIQFYLNIVNSDQSFNATRQSDRNWESERSFYRNRGSSIPQILQSGMAVSEIKNIKARYVDDYQKTLTAVSAIENLDPEEDQEQIADLTAQVPAGFQERAGKLIRKKQEEAEKASEQIDAQIKKQGFQDSVLEALLKSRMRAVRWHTKLSTYAKEEFHTQAKNPGKAQDLFNMIQKENAFKKAFRQLKKPVDVQLLEKISNEFPEDEYQNRLKVFRLVPKPIAKPVVAQPALEIMSEVEVTPALDQLISTAVSSFDNLDLPPLLGEDLVEPISKPQEVKEIKVEQKPENHKHEQQAPVKKEKEGGLFDSLSKSLGGLFGEDKKSKPTKAHTQTHKTREPDKVKTQPKIKSSTSASNVKEKSKKIQKTQQDFLKVLKEHSKDGIYVTENEFISLRQELGKNPEMQALTEDQTYVQKAGSYYLIVPAMKALNRDPDAKQAELDKIQKQIAGEPPSSKKAAALQSLYNFMSGYRTR